MTRLRCGNPVEVVRRHPALVDTAGPSQHALYGGFLDAVAWCSFVPPWTNTQHLTHPRFKRHEWVVVQRIQALPDIAGTDLFGHRTVATIAPEAGGTQFQANANRPVANAGSVQPACPILRPYPYGREDC